MRALALISLALGLSACASTPKDLQTMGKFLSADKADVPCGGVPCIIEDYDVAVFQPMNEETTLAVLNRSCTDVKLNGVSYNVVLSRLYKKPVKIRSKQNSDITYQVQYNITDCQPIGQT